MIALADIRSRDWQMELDQFAPGGLPGAGLGEVVEQLEDIAQCIAIIVTTPKGTDPLRPDFAIDLFAFIDRPMTLLVPHLVREVYAAISTYEPRIRLLSVTVQPLLDQGGAHVAVSITWQLAIPSAPVAAQTTIVTIPLAR